MPIFDFECRECKHRFEALVLKTSAACPSCGSANLEQLISNFAVSSEGTRQSNLASARRETAGTRRDKQMADVEMLKHHDD